MKSPGRALKLGVLSVIVLGLVVGFQTTCHASLALSLSDGLNTVIIVDGSLGDANPLAGVVTFVGAVGTNWIANVTTALSYPVMGTQAFPEIDLNSVNVTGTGGGTLVIRASEVDYTGIINNGLAGFNLDVGGTTSGTVSYGLFLDDSNQLFGGIGGNPVASLGPFSGPSFSGNTSGYAAATDPFSLILEASITHGAAGGDTSFDLKTTAVPVPSTVILLGSGLAGIGIVARKRFRRNRG